MVIPSRRLAVSVSDKEDDALRWVSVMIRMRGVMESGCFENMLEDILEERYARMLDRNCSSARDELTKVLGSSSTRMTF